MWRNGVVLKMAGELSDSVLYASRILMNRTEPLCDHHKNAVDNAVDKYEDDSLLCGLCDALALEQAGLLKGPV